MDKEVNISWNDRFFSQVFLLEQTFCFMVLTKHGKSPLILC